MWHDPKEAAKELAGNWRRWQRFGWWRAWGLAGPEGYAIVYYLNRDDDLLAQSNAAVIEKEMAPYLEGEGEDVFAEDHGHWACGWVKGYAIRCLTGVGSPTPAWAKWCELQGRLSDHPVLDEADLGERELDDTLCNIALSARGRVRGDAADGWECEVYSYLSENEPGAVEPKGGWGGCPNDEQLVGALRELGLLDE